MSRRYHFDHALLPAGWTRDAIISVSDYGMIEAIGTLGDRDDGGAQAALSGTAVHVSGIAVPGMANSHSHAFQRAMAGDTEYRLSARDSFWTWRQAMYALANRIEPDDLRTLATQLFIEMLKAGYTSVAEFHYLHRQPDGAHYPADGGLWDAIDAAALGAGIGLTLLPTLYQTGDFGAVPLKPEQARFALDSDWYLRAIDDRRREERRHGSTTLRTGAAFHSLRAVPLPVLREVALALKAMDPDLPVHIHVAEQVKEVEACELATGRRPIELLLDTGLVDRHWCLVHATHATAAELAGIAQSGASVCLSISTEANLGDGFFDTTEFLDRDGRVCIGSDSQISVSPAEELRWLEYQQRLRTGQRGVLADPHETHVGTRLWRDAALAGSQSSGQPAGAIDVGLRADWVILDAAHPSMAGAAPDAALDHLVFAGGQAAIRDVMVAGQWVVKDWQHAGEMPLRTRFVELMTRLSREPGAP
jgi:formimidoylglutamate deiminase